MVLGMTIFLLFPFSRLVHIWSGFASLTYLFAPVPAGALAPLEPAAGQNQPQRPA
jgi:nitrate reductase gamma subunit